MPENKFASALKKPKNAAAEVLPTDRAQPPKSPHDRPARRATKHVGGYFDPEVSRQLRVIAAEEDSSVQALLAEAIDMLFQSRKKPMIAKKAKAGD